MDLSYVKTLLVNQTRTTMGSLASPAPIGSKAVALRNLSRLFQAVAICKLLVEADLPQFRQTLMRSAHARRYYLKHVQSEGASNDIYQGLSRVEAIFDAYVAGSSELVQGIIALSIREWHRGWEYEDDFCYYAFVHGVLGTPGFLKSPECTALLKRFETALEGKTSARLELCIALQQRHADDLRAALERFLDERQMALNAKRSTITEYTAQAIFWPQSFVSIEALAWLLLARAGGMALEDSFLFCPREALANTSPPPAVEDFFESLDQALAG